jgi:hypothetical protein
VWVKCFACKDAGSPVLAGARAGIKYRPWMQVPMCETHKGRFLEKGLMYIVRTNSAARKHMLDNGWIKSGGKMRRPALDYESE